MRENIIQAYNEIDEENRLHSSQARKVEFLTTVETLDEYVDCNKKMIDIGCGAGIYSCFFARKGTIVTSIDLVPQHIEKLIEVARDENLPIKANVGDAVNLSHIASNSFDVVLCMGPLYHMVNYSDRMTCIDECKRIVKPGGIVAFAYISPLSVLPCAVRGDLSRLSDELIERILDDQTITNDDNCCFWTDSFYYYPEQIESEMRDKGFEIIDHVATDGQSIAFQNVVNSLDEEKFNLWLSYHKKICRMPSTLGVSNHGLIIVKKA